MTLNITVNVWSEGDQYIAHAMPLDVVSSGPTPQAARQAVDEAVRCFLKAAADVGTLEEVLEECGYRRHEGAWVGPDWVGVERHTVAVAV